ncbi:MAG TPA: FAD-dependent oxidoreductase [Candidatus Sulfopaludibacter sp.]|jgi:thioredoxin reductase (NADPH)|nr:FAD-dependent oxidoreductase [Candidatus Sulfopaludibacter sp.]
MSTWPTLSALDNRTQAFPVLSPEQIDRIRNSGRVREVEHGEILFEPGDTSVPFFVVLSGAMEIVQPDVDGKERLIAKHVPGEFSGEMTMITGQQCLVRGRVTEAGEFLEVSNEQMRTLVGKDADLSEVLLRAFILRRLALIKSGTGNVILMGSRHSAETLELREFLERNSHPYQFIDLDTDSVSQDLLDRFNVRIADVPVLICHGEHVLRKPTTQQLADCLGLNSSTHGDHHVRDVIIVGAGPAGLAAAVYAASEGLDVLVIETHAPGGQAGSSSKIENYLGFPTGISGMELASRASTQAQKFGAHMMIARSVEKLDCAKRPYEVVLDGGESLRARAIVIATGAQYKKPNLDNLRKFEGEGIYYGATYIESQICGTDEVAVVGGANSAGQAAVFLSQTAPKVHMLVRGGELSSTMSRYLIERLTHNPKIELHFNTEIVGLEGETHLLRIVWQDKKTGEVSRHNVPHVFLMTGALPRTEWLRGCLALDAKGFILTGRDLDAGVTDGNGPQWPLSRPAQMLETSLPGVFAVGDARAGNVKRVASAVGEGAISIHLVHRALTEM